MEQDSVHDTAPGWSLPAVELHDHVVYYVEEIVPHEQGQKVV